MCSYPHGYTQVTRHLRARNLQLIGLSGILVYLVSIVFDGVLRWLLDAYGLAQLLYLRDGLAMLGVLVALLVAKDESLKGCLRGFAIAFGALFVWWMWGAANGVHLLQGLFGVKILLTIPTGMALWVLLRRRDDWFAWFCLVLSMIAVAGVEADRYVSFPWAGLIYEIGEVTIEGQREWTIDSVERMAGFSRVSYDAGTQIAVLGAVVLGSNIPRIIKFGSAAVLMWGAVLTTSRSTTLALIVAVILSPVLCNSTVRLPCSVWQVFIWMPVGVVCAVFAFPEITGLIDAASRSGALNTESFAMRTEGNWLESLAFLTGPSSWAFGCGVGAVGAAQMPFQPELFMSPDNLCIYTLVNFGVVGTLFVFGAFSLAGLSLTVGGNYERQYLLCLIIVTVAGTLMSIAEAPFAGVAAGLALAQASERLRL